MWTGVCCKLAEICCLMLWTINRVVRPEDQMRKTDIRETTSHALHSRDINSVWDIRVQETTEKGLLINNLLMKRLILRWQRMHFVTWYITAFLWVWWRWSIANFSSKLSSSPNLMEIVKVWYPLQHTWNLLKFHYVYQKKYNVFSSYCFENTAVVYGTHNISLWCSVVSNTASFRQ